MTAIASLLSNAKHTAIDEVEAEEEPLSKQLEILMERRRQEEVRKARYHWSLLRNSIKNTITAVKEADTKNVLISHGIHHQRKINHSTELKQVLFIKELDEYLTTDGQCVRLFMSDGRKKKTYALEEPMDHVSYCPAFRQFVGWITGEDELFLMTNEFDIISQSRAPSTIVLAEYNWHTHEYITVGPGYFTTWAFRYGARHLIPRKMNRTDFREHNMFSHMVLEGTASRSQKIFLSVQTSVVVYNVFEGKLLSYKKNLHERDITALTFFNPLKYLVTGALDGTIKIWDHKWHVQMVFVGHTNKITSLDIYPHGSAIISASTDCTIRVWNLDTCDEVDRATLQTPVEGLCTTLDYDTFYTFSGQTVDLWQIQHLFHIHTSVGQRVIKIQQTTHPNFTPRSIVMSRDSSVRLVSPVSGDVLTTLLLNPNRGLIDVAYAIESETMFCVLSNGAILKVRTDTNPCRVVDTWHCEDQEKEACNYLFVYEYVVDIELKTDMWGAIKRGATTKALNKPDEEDDNENEGRKSAAIKKNNRTLLLGGRKDGYICVFDWESGKVTFKIDAHGTKGVMSMIANAKVDQLISAGKDNVIKVWRVYPFVQEALAPLMSFFCAHLPLHMTMIKTNLCVAFQDHATATYSVVMYNLRDRSKYANRYDHEPGEDHTESITGLSACSRLKLYASSSRDGTIRIWNETNLLVRLLQLKAVPHSVSFCSTRGDLLVGIGNHLHRIPHYAYMPRAYLFRMVSMKFGSQKKELPMPEDPSLTSKLNKNDLSRMKQSHSSFQYTTFSDILSPEELEEINRERIIKEKAFALLKEREDELEKIRDGELISQKKPKATARTKKVAFLQYMKMFYDKPKPTIPRDDPFPDDTLKEAVKEPEQPEPEAYKPEKEPTGFFPPAKEATRPKPPEDSPLKAAYPLRPSGFVPNSILIKLLWPQEAKDRMQRKKQVEWKLPSFSEEQLAAINKVKKEREMQELMEAKRLSISQQKPVKHVSFSKDEGDGEDVILDMEEEFDDRIIEMDWRDEEAEKQAASPNIFDEPTKTSPHKEKSKVSDAPKNKFAELMSKTPTPRPEEPEEEPSALSKGSTQVGKEPTMDSVRSQESKQASDVKAPLTPRDIKPRKPIEKLISRPPPPPPKPKSPPLPPPVAQTLSTTDTKPRKARSPSPIPVTDSTPPRPRPSSPLPGFITQFKGVDWFEKFFPNCNEQSLPKPWSLENFVSHLVKLLKTADYKFKNAIVDALLMLHAQDEFADNLAHMVIKGMSAVLNHQKDYPTCMMEEQRSFILLCLKALQKLSTSPDKEFVTELLVQFLDGDKEVRTMVNAILTSAGLQDPHKFLPKELDSWDIWNVEEDDRKSDLRKMSHQWLDRWMTSYKLHLEDAIDRMKKGQNIHGRLSKEQLRKGSIPGGKGILRRTVGTGTDQDQETVTTLDTRKGVTVTFDKPPDPSLIDNATYIDAVNYFCDMMMEKELDSMKASGKRLPGSKENVVQAKNTVLVLPKIPHKPSLVRLGETHTSHCRPHRETNLHVDYRMPPMTSRGYHPFPGQISGFVNSINLPMKPLMLNPFHNKLDEFDARFQEPVLITLRSAQKYFIPSQSIVAQDAIAAAL
ncbi:WD repeat-containing protein 97-like isoform X3 [Dreissena polymorpha]|uniref:WD repeat-containing protein 97-like isoform X3 n=1 Tax=Dreissena polymorpha TaxID=45954 RepID=UPI002264C875|nr:WD repeat-containing protein 97-like isoform X3 [Dreissena polymorpha]